MSRLPDSNTEKLNKLYEERAVLRERLDRSHKEIDIWVDKFFEGDADAEIVVDDLIIEAKKSQLELATKNAEIDNMGDM